MKKFLLAAAAAALLTTSSFAGHKNDSNDRKMRHDYYAMQLQMVEQEMDMLKKRMSMLTAYQRQLKNMMTNELASH